ncbi:MAG: TetR/AcrR family transcriptional regulator [Clostridiales bacterium]|nr:TetR/AcrR family transcriptional regulator [Clostridiales bacterium]
MRRFGYVGPYAFFILRKKGNYTPKTAAPSCLACGVSVGSIYNYFDSKAALLSETVGSVWQEIFHWPDDTDVFRDVQTCVTWIYTRIAYGCEQYPAFLLCTPSASCATSGLTASDACIRRGGIS